VIQLRKSVISPEDMDVDEASTIYSLSLSSQKEAVHTAHEKDMAMFRDLLREEGPSETTMALGPTLHQHLIKSSFGNTRTTAQASQEERLSGKVVAALPAVVVSSKPTKKPPARKATSAANFFAKNESPTKKQKKQAPTASETLLEKEEPPTKMEPTKKKQPRKQAKAMDVDEDSDASTIDFQEEKENSVNGNKEHLKFGNADDFAGDEDEDDDFLESERQRVSRKKAAAPTKPKPKTKPRKIANQPKEDVQEEGEPVPPKVHGAMDAFAQHEEKTVFQKHHKRRKRLVDKTTMDANGYLHTETQAVWEDVSDDEEERVVVKETIAKKASHKSTKHMKQGSLMGFFKKK
jgi:hypothetical protein